MIDSGGWFKLVGRIASWASCALFLVVECGVLRKIFLAVGFCDVFACGIDRFRCDAHRIGTHVGDETFCTLVSKIDPFVESLRDVHGAGSGETVMAACLLLQASR